MKYQGLIFDLDGVLCSTDRYHYQAWKQLADEEGLSFDWEMNTKLRGVSRRESFEIILSENGKKFSEDEIERCITIKNAYYQKLLEQITEDDMSSEVRETLVRLKEAGLKLAVGSSSKNAGLILKQLDGNKYFDEIVDGTQITHSKPDPEVFIKAGERLGVPATQCLVIEDAPSGVQAAKAAGMDSAGIGAAAEPGLATYQLGRFKDLITYVL